MRLPDFGLKPMMGKRGFDPRHEIAAIGMVVGVLELAAAAIREMAARRLLVMRTEGQGAIVQDGIAGHPEGDVAAA